MAKTESKELMKKQEKSKNNGNAEILRKHLSMEKELMLHRLSMAVNGFWEYEKTFMKDNTLNKK